MKRNVNRILSVVLFLALIAIAVADTNLTTVFMWMMVLLLLLWLNEYTERKRLEDRLLSSSFQWIPVSVGLPPYEASVLVANKEGDVFFCHRSCSSIVKTDSQGFCNYSESPVTHWMNIPNPIR